MLKSREECATYLTHICGHHCSGESPVKGLSCQYPSERALSTTVMSTDVSQVGITHFPSFYIFHHFTFPGFPFILISTS